MNEDTIENTLPASLVNDIAGVRVICPYISDIYAVRRELFRVAETIAITDREMEEIAIELQALD